MSSYKEKAVILKRINLGEADRIVTAFSLDSGKIRFVAKGVRKTNSKLSGSLEPFCLSELLLASGKSLDVLRSASISKNYLGLQPSLDELKFSCFVGEVIDKLLPDNAPSKSIFELFNEVLSHVKEDKDILKMYYLAKIFNNLGLYPEFDYCLKCGEKPQERLFVTKSGGGLVDENCCLYFSDSKPIDANTVKILRLIKDLPLTKVLKIKAPEQIIKETESFLGEYLKHVSNKTFKSEQI